METIFFESDVHGGFQIKYIDIFGDKVGRTKDKYPYSYEPYLISGYPCQKGNSSEYYYEFVYSDRIKELNDLSYSDSKNISVVSEILTRLWNEQIVVQAIAEGANQATGYPYYVYGFKMKKESSEVNDGLFSQNNSNELKG